MKKKLFFRRFLFFVFFLIISRSLFAQSGIFDRTGIIPGHGSYSSVPEESVDLFTGNVTLRYLDYSLPGPNGLDVKIWRVYNSKVLNDRQSGNPTLQAERRSWVGIGWTMHMGRVHNYLTDTPIIEFPDGRLETAWPDNYPDVQRNITRDFLRYDRYDNKLYFQDGTVWTFGALRTITKGDSSTEQVRLVTEIKNTYGQSITIAYDSNRSSINYITDACGRVIDFVSTGTNYNNTKLTQMKVKNATNGEVVYTYTVSTFPNGYHKLTSFAPPPSLIPATTFEYYDGTNYRYELTKVTTGYGGVLEFSYVNHDFIFNQTTLDSRVASQKKITFNPGDQAIWNFTYPNYSGVPTATATVEGPEYTTSTTHNGYVASSPWKIGLVSAKSLSDGSLSETFDWTYQELSNSNWMVLGTNMGTAKGPLISSVIRTPLGDASSKQEYLYERAEPNWPKKYGLPTKIKLYVNGAGTPKSYKELIYGFEYPYYQGYLDRYMLAFVHEESRWSGPGTLLGKTITDHYQENGKWGAVQRVMRLKTPPYTYLIWDYGYTISHPAVYSVSVNPPDPPPANSEDISTVNYSFGMADKVDEPGYTASERNVSQYNSSVLSEKNAFGHEQFYTYDNLGRVFGVNMPDPFNDVSYSWRPTNENKVVITQGLNTITKYWDGMGRETGSTETGDGMILYYRKTLDAEGRMKEENRASINSAHKYTYLYNAAGQVTRITDPLLKIMNISYAGITRTITDAESHTTSHEYNDLPGLITKLTDAQGKIADYTYDAAGRLTTVVFNGARTQSYQYDYLDNVTSETHPETGTISYTYNEANKISGRSWGGTSIIYNYDVLGQMVEKNDGQETTTYTYNSGKVFSITSTKGWNRTGLTYNGLGSLLAETVTVPGLPTSKTVHYTYDGNNNLASITYPDGKVAAYTSNSLNAPETVAFNGTSLVSNMSYGPGKAVTGMTMTLAGGSSMSFSSGYNTAGMPTTVSLIKGAAALYNATYSYDDVGNILGISSTAPALNATFGYDSLNRLTSAAYSSGRVGAYSYEYDEYGNMKTVQENGNTVFNKTYDSGNKIVGSSYDARGNLVSAGGNINIWDNQNRLNSLTNISGEILGKYLYDDSGLRLFAMPAEPEIAVTEGGKSVVDGGFVDFYAAVGPVDDQRTFTITNTGDANLILGGTPIITITGADAGDFDVIQQPGSPVYRYGGTTTFVIQFDPQTAGEKTAYISIASNDFDENPYDIVLHGYNGPPEIDVWEAPDGGTYDFGTCTVGEYIVETFTIENVGDAPLYLDHDPIVELLGQDAGQFHIDSQPGTNVIAAGDYTQFEVRFKPKAPGDKSALLWISSNDADEDPYEIAITGYGEWGLRSLGLSVTSPNGEESLKPGSSQAITWSGEEAIKSLKLEYSLDNGTSYMSLAERAENNGSYPWQIPFVLSPTCLVRVSNADGLLLRPEVVSYELKFKVESPIDAVNTGAHLRLRLGVPDLKSQSFRFAEISFLPDLLEGTESVVFNQTPAKCGGLKDYLATWHRLQVFYDLNVYAGTLLLDGQVILKDLPLQLGPWVNSLAEVSISCDKDVAAAVWVDDFEFKLQDAGFSPEDKSGSTLLLLTVAKDGFEGYKSEEFPFYGGWITSQELLAEDAALPIVDKYEYASGMQSLRLKSGDGGAALMVKRFALPERFPFDMSDANFAIANEAKVAVRSITSAESREKTSGTRAMDRERRQERLARRQKAAKSASNEESTTIRSKSDQSTKTQAGTGTDSTTRTLSALTNGGSFYIYSATGMLLAEYNRSGEPVKDYIYVGGRLLAEYKPVESRTYFYNPDQVNSTRIVTDESGTVVYSAAHDPYGGIQNTWVNTYDPTPKFSGKERDSESGLDYFGARYYDMAQYRFISVDPMSVLHSASFNPQHLNNFSFCWNNPINLHDPDGRDPTTITIVRTSFTSENVQGYLLINGQPTGIMTLELPWNNNIVNESCIKLGIYNASVWHSAEMGVDVIRLVNQNGRTDILIHGGTTVGNTDGCILVGLDINATSGVLEGGADARQEIIDYCQSSGWFPSAGASSLVAWGEAYFAYCQNVLAWQRDERVIVEVTLSPALWATIGLSILSAF